MPISGIGAAPSTDPVASLVTALNAATTATTAAGSSLTAAAASYVKQIDQFSPARGMVIFCIDDCKSAGTPLLAIHDALGQKVALGVVSSDVDTAGYMTSAQLLAAHNNGHELANHSSTHPNYTTQTAAQRATETDTCSTFINSLTSGYTPKTFIYPQGAWSATTDRELYTRFRSWRATVSAATNLPTRYPLGDTCPRFYAVDVGDPLNLTRAQELLRLAAKAPIIVSFYIHYADDVGVITSTQYQSLAQLARTLGVPAVLPRDAIGGQSAFVDPSFEVTGMPGWFATLTGSAAYAQVTATPDAGISGTQVLSMTATNPDSALLSTAIVVKPGVVYRCSGRVQVLSGNLVTNDFAVRLRWRNWDETAISTSSNFPTLSGTGVWARFEVDVTAPANSRFVYFDLMNLPNTGGRSGTLYVDHIDFRPTDHGGMG